MSAVLVVVIVWAGIALVFAFAPWVGARQRYLTAEARIAKLEQQNAESDRLLRACARELASSLSPREAALSAMLADSLPPRESR